MMNCSYKAFLHPLIPACTRSPHSSLINVAPVSLCAPAFETPLFRMRQASVNSHTSLANEVLGILWMHLRFVLSPTVHQPDLAGTAVPVLSALISVC